MGLKSHKCRKIYNIFMFYFWISKLHLKILHAFRNGQVLYCVSLFNKIFKKLGQQTFDLYSASSYISHEKFTDYLNKNTYRVRAAWVKKRILFQNA